MMSDETTSSSSRSVGTVPVLAIMDRATARELTVAQLGALAASAGMTLAVFVEQAVDLLF